MPRLLCLSVLALALSGCAANYVVPTGSRTALVRFNAEGIGANDNVYFLKVKPGPGCTDTVGQSLASLGAAIGNKRLSDVRMIGSTGEASRLRYEREVEAGDDIRIFTHWYEAYNPYGYYYSCELGASINLEAGKQYELNFERSGCKVRLYELTQGSVVVDVKELPVRAIPVTQSTDLCGF